MTDKQVLLDGKPLNAVSAEELTHETPGFSDSIKMAVEERVQFILQNRERLIDAWVAETGLLPSQSCLVERSHNDGTLVVTVEPRPGFMACSRCKHRVGMNDNEWEVCMLFGSPVETSHYCAKFEGGDDD